MVQAGWNWWSVLFYAEGKIDQEFNAGCRWISLLAKYAFAVQPTVSVKTIAVLALRTFP